MIYNGHFEPHFLYKSMYRSAADMDQERYRMYSDRLVSNPGDIEAIAEMVRLLHHYIFDRAGIHIKRTEDPIEGACKQCGDINLPKQDSKHQRQCPRKQKASLCGPVKNHHKNQGCQDRQECK